MGRFLLVLAINGPMNIITAISAIVLFGAAVGMVTSPLAFADHPTATVRNPVGTSVPGCEETDECFIPSVVTVDVGGTVTWINEDAAAHTITSGVLADGGPDGVFDSGLFAPETEFSHTFDAVGEYQYFCMVHPWMAGLVIVQEASDDAMTDDTHDDAMTDDTHDDAMTDDTHDDAMTDDETHDDMVTDDMTMSDEPTMVGALSDGTPVMITATEVAAGEPMKVKIVFEDSEHVNYDIIIHQGDEAVLESTGAHEHAGMGEHMTGALPTGDPVDITVTFQGYGVDDLTGPIGDVVIFANVVPEFGTIAVVILAAAIVSIVAVSARSRLSLVPRY